MNASREWPVVWIQSSAGTWHVIGEEVAGGNRVYCGRVLSGRRATAPETINEQRCQVCVIAWDRHYLILLRRRGGPGDDTSPGPDGSNE
jgi:hypothetical protein